MILAIALQLGINLIVAIAFFLIGRLTAPVNTIVEYAEPQFDMRPAQVMFEDNVVGFRR